MSTELFEIAGLSVELIRKPIKNLHIGVYPPHGRVRVAAPSAISEDAIRVAVVTRLGWIKKKQREFEGQARQTERQYVSGETHFFFGRPLRLMVKTAATRRGSIQPEGSDRLIMTVPEEATSQQKALWFKDWSRAQLKGRAPPRVAKWAERLGVATPRWGIKRMRTKWGNARSFSCARDQSLNHRAF